MTRFWTTKPRNKTEARMIKNVRRRISKMLFASLFVLLISSCGTTPPDTPFCTEINPSTGFCVNTISSKEFIVDDENLFEGKTWWEIRPFMILMPIESWTKIKAFIIKICKRSNKCSSSITNWERTVKIIDKNVKKI